MAGKTFFTFLTTLVAYKMGAKWICTDLNRRSNCIKILMICIMFEQLRQYDNKWKVMIAVLLQNLFDTNIYNTEYFISRFRKREMLTNS